MHNDLKIFVLQHHFMLTFKGNLIFLLSITIIQDSLHLKWRQIQLGTYKRYLKVKKKEKKNPKKMRKHTWWGHHRSLLAAYQRGTGCRWCREAVIGPSGCREHDWHECFPEHRGHSTASACGSGTSWDLHALTTPGCPDIWRKDRWNKDVSILKGKNHDKCQFNWKLI